MELITLGGADIWVNGVDVGYVQNVSYSADLKYVDFQPSNAMGPIKQFRISEAYSIKCKAAELRLGNLQLALGAPSSQGTASTTPSGLGASLSFTPGAGTKWNKLTFGGNRIIPTFPLELIHTRPNGNEVVIILYKAECISKFDLPFNEKDVATYDMEFSGLHDVNRAAGDQVGVIYEQV